MASPEGRHSMTEPPGWADILDEPFVALILGRRGSGKTALGHTLLEEFANDRDAYIMGYPRTKMDLLPDWIDHLPVTIPFDKWPEGAIILVTEAHHLIHARRSLSDENLDVDRLISLSRQRDLDILLDSQYARRLDVTGVMGATAMIWRYPSLMQEDFERRQLRKFVREAKSALDDYVEIEESDHYTLLEDTDQLKKHAYVFAERFRGVYPHEIDLPSYWSEEISKAIGAKDDSGTKVNDVPPAQAVMAEIEDVDERSTEEIENLLEDHDIDFEEEAPSEEADVQAEQFIDRMIDSGNPVMGNPYGEPIVELIVPRHMKEQTEALVQKWDLNPSGHGILPQPPSFAEDRPEVSDGLISFQFLLNEQDELGSSGYDINSIVDELPAGSFIMTKANRVQASLPIG